MTEEPSCRAAENAKHHVGCLHPHTHGFFIFAVHLCPVVPALPSLQIGRGVTHATQDRHSVTAKDSRPLGDPMLYVYAF